MNIKKSAAESIFQICSYEHLGVLTNYDSNNLAKCDFDHDLYRSSLSKFQTSTLSRIIHNRKSYRVFNNTFEENTLQSILFNAYSLTDQNGSYTIPQAGGLPTMGLIIISNCEKKWQLYKYNPSKYELNYICPMGVALDALFYTKSIDFDSAKYCIIITSDLETISKQYLARGFKFSCFQAGHIAQNILLYSTELNIKAIPLGSLIEDNIQKTCLLPTNYYPLYAVIM